jgi:hypothetical protein
VVGRVRALTDQVACASRAGGVADAGATKSGTIMVAHLELAGVIVIVVIALLGFGRGSTTL